MAPAFDGGLPQLETLWDKKIRTSRYSLKVLDYLRDMPQVVHSLVWKEHFDTIHKFLRNLYAILQKFCHQIMNCDPYKVPQSSYLPQSCMKAKCKALLDIIECIQFVIQCIKRGIHLPCMNEPKKHDIICKILAHVTPYFERILLKFLW